MSLLNKYISKRMGSKEENALITFLKRTKDGEYAKIDERQLTYPRVKEQREPYYNDEEYYLWYTIATPMMIMPGLMG